MARTFFLSQFLAACFLTFKNVIIPWLHLRPRKIFCRGWETGTGNCFGKLLPVCCRHVYLQKTFFMWSVSNQFRQGKLGIRGNVPRPKTTQQALPGCGQLAMCVSSSSYFACSVQGRIGGFYKRTVVAPMGPRSLRETRAHLFFFLTSSQRLYAHKPWTTPQLIWKQFLH